MAPSLALAPALAFLLAHAASAALPPQARVGDGFGVGIHALSVPAPELALLRRAFRAVRMDLSWPLVESACGAYDFSAADALLAQTRAAGLRSLVLILDYNNQKCYDGGGPSANSCNSAACVSGFVAFARAAAQHFAAAGAAADVVLECQNEPNGMGGDSPAALAAMCRGAGVQVRAAGLRFIGPSTLQFDLPYLAAAIGFGLLEGLDAVSVHAFGAFPPEAALSNYTALAALVAAADSDASLVQSEAGFPSAPPPCAPAGYPGSPMALAAKFLVRTTLVALAAGAGSLSSLYDWKDDAGNASECDRHWGVVAADLAPKPAFLAAVALQEALGDAGACLGLRPTTLASMAATNDVFALAFDGGGGPTPSFAVWTTEPSCAPTAGRTPCGPPGAGANFSACLLADEGCCFDEYAGDGGPACFARRLPASGATFSVAPASGDASFRLVGAFGNALAAAHLNASGGELTVPRELLSDGPLYVLPVAARA
jgi:hypothetical protein